MTATATTATIWDSDNIAAGKEIEIGGRRKERKYGEAV
jgi:hypothetical protein